LNAFEELFSGVNGGHVLDVATGEGGYITILQRYLGGFSSITGIDTNKKVLCIARETFDFPHIYFSQMDAEYLGFDDGSFDTVNLSASLHHLENVRRVLAEMKRVLKPGGKFILTEMHRDGATTAQFNAIRIHHWAAMVDTSLGSLHDRTFARQEILDFMDELQLVNMTTRDFPNTNTEPHDEKTVTGIINYLVRYHQRLEKIPLGETLLQQEGELRASLAENGFQREPVLIVIADKA